jgi:hypothetical protein
VGYWLRLGVQGSHGALGALRGLKKLALYRCQPKPVRFKGVFQMKAKLAALAALSTVSGLSFAADPADALAAVTGLSTSATGFGPVMFGLAVTVVGIMIGVKWIKRAKGAA